MSTALIGGQTIEEKIQRAQKLANGRKQLKKYQTAKTSDTSFPLQSTNLSISTSQSSLFSSTPIPLVTDLTGNTANPQRGPAGGSKLKELDSFQLDSQSPSMVRSPGKLRKSRSKGSMSHRRQNSSISHGGGLARGSVLDLFGMDENEPRAMRAELPRLAPEHIITTPATPLLERSTLDEPEEEDREAVKSRLTAFSFGAKPPVRSPQSRARPGQPLLPSQLMPTETFPSPNSSPSKRLSTPLSRPPSLLLTRPTPLAFGTPTAAGPSRQAESPQTPPTPARTKRHSHTRSNSISLPNLKLGSRPTSLGIPSSPSFPSSPSSPSTVSRPGSQVQGTRLKFEPSGRGAEAEKEKDEYRRKALEKLTGSPSPVFPDSPGNEIALPDLDDEDGSSVASSARPVSGFGSFTFGRPSSSSSTPSGYSWSTNEDSPPMERWSTGFNAKTDEKEDALGFGFTFSGTGSGSFSFGAIPPQPAYETGIGMGLPSTMPARPSLTRNLSVLAEVDEPEDGEVDEEDTMGFTQSISEQPMPMSPSEEDVDDDDTATYVPIVAPTPSRLRELHLVSSASTPGSARSTGMTSMSSGSGSPTKGYGAIGRGRPAPLPHIKTDSPASASSLISTPKSGGGPRRKDPRSGSRGSSISYKKDNDSSTSSRDWSFSTKAPFSPPTAPAEITSPTFSPPFTGWGNMPRSGPSRPCPRPKSLAGLGIDNQGAGRILAEVEEEDEDAQSSRNPSYRLSSQSSLGRTSSDDPRDSFGVFSWRDPQLELEMERDALREDVDLWKQRCGSLDDKLEAEKKENLVLRERVRKLGDRLSSMSSYPVTKDRDASLVADLRTQLFGVQVELDRERNARLLAQDNIHELEAQIASMKVTSTASPPVITNVIPPTPLSPDGHFEYPTPISSASPATSLTPDMNAGRMKAWGFPRGPVPPSQSRNRESFFGLSQVLRRGSGEEEREHGVDLPPFMLTPESIADSPQARAVSDPTPQHGSPPIESEVERRSTSLTSSASTALSFFADYLPKYSRAISPPAGVAISPKKSFGSFGNVMEKRGPECGHESGRLDWSDKCGCCIGEVLEL